MNAEPQRTLDELADDFASKLTALTRGVLGKDSPRFHAVNMGARIRVAPINENERVQRIPISIDGSEKLSLLACYYCCWDGASEFLATDQDRHQAPEDLVIAGRIAEAEVVVDAGEGFPQRPVRAEVIGTGP